MTVFNGYVKLPEGMEGWEKIMGKWWENRGIAMGESLKVIP